MWGISILADFRLMGYKLSYFTVVVFALGKNLLFKFALGHCENLVPIFGSFIHLVDTILNWQDTVLCKNYHEFHSTY